MGYVVLRKFESRGLDRHSDEVLDYSMRNTVNLIKGQFINQFIGETKECKCGRKFSSDEARNEHITVDHKSDKKFAV